MTGRAALLAVALAAPLQAQNLPQLPPGMTPDQAAALLQQSPELGAQLRQRLLSSGLSPEQVRSRLRAAGYPPNLLDRYLGGDTLPPAPGQVAAQAASALRLTEFLSQDSLSLSPDSVAARLSRDSLRIDSIIRSNLTARLAPRLQLFGLETFRLVQDGDFGRAAGYVLGTNALGLAAVWVGYRCIERI